MAFVSLIINWRGDEEYTLDSREFDLEPRVGDTIMLTEAVDMRKPAYHGMAELRVTRIVHDMRVGYTHAVHAFVYVEPIGDALDVLDHLYPVEDEE